MILVAGYIILTFTLIQLLVAAANLIFNQPFSRKQRKSNTLISVLIPARNEEKNIGNILTDLQKQKYSNIEIIVFNDQSTDETQKIVQAFADTDSRIKLINSEALPAGWLGKNYACHSLSKVAKGSFLQFIDADVRLSGTIIGDVWAKTKKQKLALLSIFPEQIMKSGGEWISVPIMNYILLSLLPLVLVYRSKKPSLAAANGQFMFFNAKIYKHFFPHKIMKSEKVEDIKIARFLKKHNLKTACLTGNKNVSCRMYRNYSEAVMGFSKNIIMFFGNSLVLALIFWTITTFGFLAVWFAFSKTVFAVYLATVLIIRLFISFTSKQNAFYNLVLIIPQQITMGVFIVKAIVNKWKKQFEWKGRNIS